MRTMSVAGQMLALQLVAVLLAVLGVTPVLAVFEERNLREVESRRALATAETMASTSVIQAGLARGTDAGVAGEAERTRSVSGAAAVVIRDGDGSIVYSSDPSVSLPTGGSGSSVAVVDDGTRLISASVPVVNGSVTDGARIGALVGRVSVAREFPHPWQRIGALAPALLTYVLVGAGVGLAGSLLISRRIKRVTFGLEPQEIRGLVEHREAMLHGLREGVVGVDLRGRLTVVNDEARRLLDLPATSEGRAVDDLGLDPVLADALCGRIEADDRPLARSGRMLVLNQLPAVHEGRQLGWVSTVRDRTEQVELGRQVSVWRDATDVLRAQAHEFSNRMHTVAGLVELGEYDDLAAYLSAQRKSRSAWSDLVLRCVRDRPLAALLIAKGSQATERELRLELDPASDLDPLPADLVDDLLTVVGNLLDNAMDAVGHTRGRVSLLVVGEDDQVRVRVDDDGHGADPETLARVFDSGFSTKDGGERDRGWGLALCRMACEQRGGWIRASSHEGTTSFEAGLPWTTTDRRTTRE